MKYIEKKYQQLIHDMQRAYDGTCDTLKYHINELKKTIAEKNEEIEKLKGGDQIQKEADECKRLKEDLAAARASAEAWETRFYTLVHQYGIDLNKPVEKKNVEKAKKQVKKPSPKKGSFLITCQVCGKSFFAKSKSAKYCKACRKEKNREYQRKWQAKRSK